MGGVLVEANNLQAGELVAEAAGWRNQQ